MTKLTIKIFSRLRIVYLTILMLFVSATLFSQENREEKLLLSKASELAFSDPDETIKIANHLLKKEQSVENTVTINLLIARSYETKGDYNNSVRYAFEASKNSRKVSDSLKVEILFLKADISRKLHLYNQVNHYLSKIKMLSDELKSDKIKESAKVRTILERAYVSLERLKYAETIKLLDSIENKNKTIVNQDYNLKKGFIIAKAQALNGLGEYKMSRDNFEKIFTEYRSQKQSNLVLEIKILNGFGKVYFEQKDYIKSIDVLLSSLNKATKINNTPLLEEINYLLAANYLVLNNKIEQKKYTDQFFALNTASLEMETEAVNSMYNFLSEEQEADYKYEKNRLMLFTYIVTGVLAVIILCYVILYTVNKAKRKRLKEIIGYLEVTNNLLVKSYADKKEPNKKISIPTETEQNILAKLKRFENSIKYTNKDMSLATLAAQFDVNTKYLSEIINKHYQDNFNTYINRLRINYIIEKLKNEPEYLNYKISYLAEESGFSSHSSFATVFKTITGIAPTIFIDLIGKEVNKKKA